MRKRVLFLWRQEDTNSLRLFSVDSSGRQMISNFSLRQRLHLLLELLYDECGERIDQMQKWLPINYSFIFVLISLTSLVSMRKIQKNFHTKMRLVSLISIQIKE